MIEPVTRVSLYIFKQIWLAFPGLELALLPVLCETIPRYGAPTSVAAFYAVERISAPWFSMSSR
ncbi:hypothetical protein B932_1921 [Gluconobacter oxydans H24]|nr:hypothetical protein B932_1921 [Gluconobacter oxydans H24]GAC88825.1 hypothetical protein NBRC3255_2486 [Gluconobacter thailandicus NBRC 3255]